jgi:hypothetical protein
MKYFKDIDKNVSSYEDDGSQDHLIGDKTLMTTAEVDEHINPARTLALAKSEAEQRIKDGFINALELGTFASTALAIDVDNRRYMTYNDKANLMGLIEDGVYPQTWIGVSASAEIATEAKAIELRNEMTADAKAKYSNKWTKEAEITDMVDPTIAKYDAIIW